MPLNVDLFNFLDQIALLTGFLQVPALSVSLSEDNVKLDRELIAHGASNMLAGLTGTVPNYLTYVNTVLCKSIMTYQSSLLMSVI